MITAIHFNDVSDWMKSHMYGYFETAKSAFDLYPRRFINYLMKTLKGKQYLKNALDEAKKHIPDIKAQKVLDYLKENSENLVHYVDKKRKALVLKLKDDYKIELNIPKCLMQKLCVDEIAKLGGEVHDYIFEKYEKIRSDL